MVILGGRQRGTPLPSTARAQCAEVDTETRRPGASWPDDLEQIFIGHIAFPFTKQPSASKGNGRSNQLRPFVYQCNYIKSSMTPPPPSPLSHTHSATRNLQRGPLPPPPPHCEDRVLDSPASGEQGFKRNKGPYLSRRVRQGTGPHTHSYK